MKDRRQFLKAAAAGVAVLPAACSHAPAPHTPTRQAYGADNLPNGGQSRALITKNPERPEPSTLDRLPVEWHKERAKLLQEKAGAKGADLIWITDSLNQQYFTGLFCTVTERLMSCFIPVKELKAHFYYPGLDRDIVESWWHDESEYYFDMPHADGGFPNRGVVKIGPPVDLTRWMLESIAKRGFAKATIAVDRPLTVKGLEKYRQILPGARFIEIDDICMGMRMVKTSEEIALTQRAMDYAALAHAFARDYLLARGTDCTDWEIQCETERFLIDIMMNDIKRDGRPHSAVGCAAEVLVRSGLGTAYPHPNQFHHNRINRGDAIQIVCIAQIGGYNGEQYRACHIEPVPELGRRMWEVHTEATMIQARESKAGVRCQDVAKAVHEYQVNNGMAEYIYHRPAHGQGIEGHQPPYIALGDETVLVEGMMFSNEPGLYSPKDGFGYNHGDNVLVTKTKGIQMGPAPLTKEWCFVKL
jgi:Xaa-Pro aminopeptidase